MADRAVDAQRRYHAGLFATLAAWDIARDVAEDWRVGEDPAVPAGMDQLGHFGPPGCDLVVDRVARDLPDGVGVLVELGSGLGGALRYVADRLRRRGVGVGTALGVELVPEHCAAADVIAASLGATNCRSVCASAERLPLADGSVDAVVVTGSMPHFARPGRVLAEASRVLRPGGVLVLTEEVSIAAPGRTAGTDFRALHPSGVFFLSSAAERRRHLRAAGLTPVEERDLTDWAHQLLGERLRALRMFRGVARSLFGDAGTDAVERTLTVARDAYAAGDLVPMLVHARRSAA
ncbi:class I SAM-dependent methyltransferase [Geodermatophilus sp. SYSU D01186]